MARRTRGDAPDQADREAAVHEQTRNVLIDAGAGTGKTTILVERLVEKVAPTGGAQALPIGRVAAITFTRKAAGELRLRIRERLLEGLSEEPDGTPHAIRLREALAGLDTAYVGTIHSFADRLLRTCPVEAQLSPSYEIAEDDGPLVRETFEVLMHAVEKGTLVTELAGTDAHQRAGEAAGILRDALDAGIQAASREGEWKVYYGIDALVEGWVRQRDVPPPDVPPAAFDAAEFRAAADEFLREAAFVSGESDGANWIRETAEALRRAGPCEDPVELFRGVRLRAEREPRNPTLSVTFQDDKEAWRVWNLYKKGRGRVRPLRTDLLAPMSRWLASRLVRLFPVVVALYERVKARHRALDQLDLLAKLRDLLAENKEVRKRFQGMFDHLFVDEFQDTDPLQAEVVLYLCEREPRADRWDEVVLGDGRLTLVGDPKQSIYRFRRADVAAYDRVRQIVARGPHLEAKLSANFRSVPPLIEWLNVRFTSILGAPRKGMPFDPANGQVFQQLLLPGRVAESPPPVQALEFDIPEGQSHGADDYRELEGRVLAGHLRALVESDDAFIVDPLDGRRRRIRYGDIAVLAVTTWKLSLLFPWLDAAGIPYASRGGTLFLADPLHRQFLLGLRAVADKGDGVAEAAVLRPPFFAVDPGGLILEASGDGDAPSHGTIEDAGPAGDPSLLRAREARELVRDLRRRRFERPPGATARDLLEKTGFARSVAHGPNGAQRLARLRELCAVLDQDAAAQGLDYDGVTARMRDWVEHPVQLDPPHPVGTEAVQVLTVHQAKGLEFPVVALWDGRALWSGRSETGAWRVDRGGHGWMLDLAQLTWEEPRDLGILLTERAYCDQERRRVLYVAATRARDVLIVPKAGKLNPEKHVCGALLAEPSADAVRSVAVGSEPAAEGAVQPTTEPVDGTRLERETDAWWSGVAQDAALPRFQSTSVSSEAHRSEEPAQRAREGRFGPLFGTAVHQAIGLALADHSLDDAVRRAAEIVGLRERLAEARADVGRAIDALRAEGLARSPGTDLRIEYPVAAAWEGGKLLGGILDLVAVTDGRTDVLDFKTDAPPRGQVAETYPEYVSQVRAYGRLLELTGLATARVRCGLLFTADGTIRWVDPV